MIDAVLAGPEIGKVKTGRRKCDSYRRLSSDVLVTKVKNQFWVIKVQSSMLHQEPSSVSGDHGRVRIVSGFPGNNQRSNNPERPNTANNCPCECDPVKAFGGPKLSRPDIFSAA